ncbi:MAG: radical SAM protein [Candidatus Thorarchaeota archaeon]
MLQAMWKIYRPDSLRVWKDPEAVKRLGRYRGIIDKERWAKYLLAKDIDIRISLDESLEDLWKKHGTLSDRHSKYMSEIDSGSDRAGKDSSLEPTFLDLKIEIANRILQACHFCERKCGADRTRDEKGWCKLGKESRVSSAFLHSGEEAPLVPSGTIFFASCCFGCVFCQNDDISTNPNSGQVINTQELAILAEALFRDGALNINYVGGDPIPNTHTIVGSLKHQTSNITQLWNSNLYCSEDTMRLLADVFDVWLPDFKYGNNACAERLSGVKDYFTVVSRNHSIAYRHGEVIIRHLVMPNHLECCTIPILEWVAENMPNCLVNIMGQYRPEHRVRREREKYQDIARRVSGEEMRLAREKADSLGICWRPVS